MDGFTLREVIPYYKERLRMIISRELLLSFFMGEDYKPYKPEVRKKNVIGGFCNGKYVKKCRNTFGDALGFVCKTCPD